MKKFSGHIRVATFLAAVAILPGIALAATQGSIGTTSTGTVDVTLTVPELFRISGLADLALGTYSGTGTMTGNDDLCVYQNGDGTYQVTATTGTGAFEVNDGGTNDIAMEVRWNDVTTTTGNAALTYNTAAAQTGANTTIADCSSGGDSANIQVNFTQTNLQAAVAAAYTATITLLVEPG